MDLEQLKSTKWVTTRLNQRFLKRLWLEFGGDVTHKVFTNHDAYELYFEHHARHHGVYKMLGREIVQGSSNSGDSWMQMSVRNQLCAATERCVLVRVSPGHYEFPYKMPSTFYTTLHGAAYDQRQEYKEYRRLTDAMSWEEFQQWSKERNEQRG